MNKKTKRIAATLLTAGAIFACISMATKPSQSSKAPLCDHDPVTIAQNNTLAKTPDEIADLTKGLDIDIRNSAFLILQEVKNNTSYTWDEGNGAISYFLYGSILTPMRDDPAIANLADDDYRDCVASYGEDANCWMIYWEGSPTWKTKVIDKILSSERLQEILYNWVKPELTRVVRGMNQTQISYMKGAINHMIDYTAAYNHKAEKQFYNACVAADYTDLFTCGYKIENMNVDYSEVVNPYRRLEAWVYRRVEDGTMSANQVNGWLKKVKNDLGF